MSQSRQNFNLHQSDVGWQCLFPQSLLDQNDVWSGHTLGDSVGVPGVHCRYAVLLEVIIAAQVGICYFLRSGLLGCYLENDASCLVVAGRVSLVELSASSGYVVSPIRVSLRGHE